MHCSDNYYYGTSLKSMFTNHWQCSIKGIKIKKEEKNWKRIYYLNKERPMLDCWTAGAVVRSLPPRPPTLLACSLSVPATTPLPSPPYAGFRCLRKPLLLQRALTSHQVCPPLLFLSCCVKPSTQSLT